MISSGYLLYWATKLRNLKGARIAQLLEMMPSNWALETEQASCITNCLSLGGKCILSNIRNSCLHGSYWFRNYK